MHNQVRESLVNPIEQKPYVVKRNFGNWRDEILAWYNKWILDDFLFEKKHLYIYGPSLTGKTHFVNFLLGSFLTFKLKSNKKF